MVQIHMVVGGKNTAAKARGGTACSRSKSRHLMIGMKIRTFFETNLGRDKYKGTCHPLSKGRD